MKRRYFLAGLGFAANAFATSASAQDGDGLRMAERFAATLSGHDLPAFGALFATDYTNHQVSAATPAPGSVSAKQATVDLMAGRLAATPDVWVTIETAVATPGRVAASFAYGGTQTGGYLGVPATGRALRLTSCDIST